MSKNNAKSLTTLRQKLRKYTRDFEEEIRLFRENPDAEDSDVEKDEVDEDDDDSIMDDDEPLGPAAFKKEPSIPK